jgi:hypothetical protein
MSYACKILFENDVKRDHFGDINVDGLVSNSGSIIRAVEPSDSVTRGLCLTQAELVKTELFRSRGETVAL